MTAAPSSGPGRLAVVLDIRHPFSYLALRPAFEFVEQARIEAEWLPIRAHTLIEPSAPAPDDDRGIRHRRFRAQMIAREIEVYSGAQGLRIESPYRDGKSDAVHRAWLWVLESAPARFRFFVEEAFRRYWTARLDPDDLAHVVGLLEEMAFDVSLFREWVATAGPDALRAAAARVAALGVFQAPAYVLNGEVFLGRQHLPMIRWRLDGRQADRPI